MRVEDATADHDQPLARPAATSSPTASAPTTVPETAAQVAAAATGGPRLEGGWWAELTARIGAKGGMVPAQGQAGEGGCYSIGDDSEGSSEDEEEEGQPAQCGGEGGGGGGD